MEAFSKLPHPVVRDGVSQGQRSLAALTTDLVKIDDREASDMMDFLFNFARQVNYFDEKLERDDWTFFFSKALPVQITLIGKTDIGRFSREFEQICAFIEQEETFESFNLLLDLLLKIAFQVHDWMAKLEGDASGLLAFISNLVDTDLRHELSTTIGFANAAQSWGYVPARSIQEFTTNQRWKLRPFDLLAVETSILQIRGSQKNKVRRIKKSLAESYRILFSGLREIVVNAPDYFSRSLSSKDDHAPHLGLLFAFLELFKKSQEQLNGLRQRHLEFFYKDILGLKEAEAVPDNAHLIFDLADNLDAHLIEQGRLFFAGEDRNEEDILFKLEREIVVTHAEVTSLRTLFLHQIPTRPPEECDCDGKGDTEYKVQGVYMAPIANSADGQGEAFPGGTTPSWPTLGSNESQLPVAEPTAGGDLGFQPMPQARLGLILASPVLFLQEGRREIDIQLCICQDSVDALGGDANAIFDALDSTFRVTEQSIQLAVENGLPEASALTLSGITSTTYFRYSLLVNAIESLLSLPEEVELILQYAEIYHPFEVALSGEAGWVYPQDYQFLTQPTTPSICDSGRYIRLRVYLEESYPAITFFDPVLFGEEIGTNFPAVRLTYLSEAEVVFNLGTADEDRCALYHFLRDLTICDVCINVTVCGVQNLILQHNGSILDINQPFMPFGPEPVEGDNFIIGSKEIFCKNWEQAWVNLCWETPPTEIPSIYESYFEDAVDSAIFQYGGGLLLGGSWAIESGSPKALFASSSPLMMPDLCMSSDFEQSFQFMRNSFTPPTNLHTIENPDPLAPFTIAAQNGYLRLQFRVNSDATVNPNGLTDFYHQEYINILARQALAMALLPHNDAVPGAIYFYCGNGNNIKFTYPTTIMGADDGSGGTENVPITNPNEFGDEVDDGNLKVFLPPPPYTPTITKFALNYTAKANLADIEIIHLLPYTGTYLVQDDPSVTPSVLPNINKEGQLFLGLSNLQPGSNLNLLFQMAESTADPFLTKAQVDWAYLKDNTWCDLVTDVNVLLDETNGLVNSGLIEFAIPEDINLENTILPNDLHWIRACARERALAVAQTIQVHAQAARVVFAPSEDSDTTRLSLALPPGSISEAVEDIVQIEGFEQLYNAFGGRPKEQEAAFYTRVSEHLRHKGRAITLYDYERLVLQHFPEIFKVKCINHTLGRNVLAPDNNGDYEWSNGDFEWAPGFVTIAVIPNLDNENIQFADRQQPRATAATLERIKQYLRQLTSPFVCIRVLNPSYEAISVCADVKFVKGKSKAFYEQQLIKDIDRFLTPWAFGDTGAISFGGTVFQSAILNHMEKLDYVDYIENFEMRDADNEAQLKIKAAKARSILVAGNHKIKALEESECCKTDTTVERPQVGIGFEKLGDLKITPN